MSQPLTRRKPPRRSLRGPRAAHTVLSRMAQDQERAERIRALKDARPDLTWRRIGDAVGVSERSAVEWQRTGGIDYGNAQVLAQLFEVDFDWLWRGPKPDTPDLLPTVSGQLDGVSLEFRGRVDQVEERLRRIEQRLEERARHDEQVQGLLRHQTELLETIRALVGFDSEVTLQDRLAQMVRDAAAAAGPGPEPRARSGARE